MRLFTKSLIAAATLAGMATAASAADPSGTWTRPSTGAKISFYDCSGKLCAKIVGVKDETKKSMVGKVIMTGATKSGDNAWKGDLLNLEDGNTYSGTVTMISASSLNLKGCALGGLVCKDENLVK